MFSVKKYNKNYLFSVDVSGLPYKSLDEVYDNNDVIYPVHAIYINTKSKYGDHPTLVVTLPDGSMTYLNLPQHMLSACLEMLDDPEAVEAINSGFVAVQIHKYYQAHFDKMCFGVNWVDTIPDAPF